MRIATAALVGALVGAAVVPAFAGSGVVLPHPLRFGRFAAVTHGEAGEALGPAELSMERNADGSVRIEVLARGKGKAYQKASARLVPTDDGKGLRLTLQEARSVGPDGEPFPLVRVDHEARVATCTDAEGAQLGKVELPASDRVVNVPLNLLFLPLAERKAEKIEFQMFLCGGGARVLDFSAVASVHDGKAGNELIRVSYEPRLGPMLDWIAASLVPELAFWFDPANPGDYLGHRMPLYQRGPEVTVAREGIAVASLPAKP